MSSISPTHSHLPAQHFLVSPLSKIRTIISARAISITAFALLVITSCVLASLAPIIGPQLILFAIPPLAAAFVILYKMKQVPCQLTIVLLAHARFHRKKTDGVEHSPSFSLLDGIPQHMVFKSFIRNDIRMTSRLLRSARIKSPLFDSLEEVMNRSKTYFSFVKRHDTASRLPPMILKGIQSLPNNKSLIFPGGFDHHAVIFEMKKEENGCVLKLYNSGSGTDHSPSAPSTKFVVPQYFLGKDVNLEEIIRLLCSLYTYPLKRPFNTVVKQLIVDRGGIPLPSSETHSLQDRGNCALKSLSTWIHAKIGTGILEVTPELVIAARNMSPPLDIQPAQGQWIRLCHLIKMVAYEQIRADLKKSFFTKDGSSLNKGRCSMMVNEIYRVTPQIRLPISRTNALLYLQSLVEKIVTTSAIDHYRKKKFPSHISPNLPKQNTLHENK